VDVATAARELANAGAVILGANCGSTSPAEMVEVVQEFREHTALPLLVRMNAGTPVLVDGQAFYPETAESMAAGVPALIEAGAAIIGGCCGTSPEYISRMVSARDRTEWLSTARN
jgi:5-methyltetrahydrofolate--homocysteine methyltransferase